MIKRSMIKPVRLQQTLWLRRIALCAVLGGLLAGCTTLTLTYNYAERLLLWRIDRYFELSNEQDRLVKAGLADLHVWHRHTELPRYAEFLHQVRDRWRDGVTAEEIDWAFEGFAKFRASLADRVAAAGAVFLPTVNAKQIGHLQKVVQRENREWHSRAGTPGEERSVKRTKTVVGWLRDWLGPLTPEQERLAARLLKELPDTTDETLAYRTHRQQQFVQLLQSRPDAAVIEHWLQEWLATPEKNAPSAYTLSLQHFRHDVKTTVLAIDRTVTPRQRNHASEKLQKLIRDIQRLAAG